MGGGTAAAASVRMRARCHGKIRLAQLGQPPNVAFRTSRRSPRTYLCYTYGYSGWVNVAGTSISSPDWAAFLTIVNSLRAAQGKGTLSQAAYDLYQAYYSGSYTTDFHDITTGNNGNCGSQCNTGPGFDLVTGIGTYQANTLAPALVAYTN